MTDRKLTLNDIRAAYPTCKRVAYITDFFAWVQNLDGSIHNLSKDIDGTLIRCARPDVADFDKFVQLHLDAANEPEEEETEEADEEEPEDESYWPDNPRDQWGTY